MYSLDVAICVVVVVQEAHAQWIFTVSRLPLRLRTHGAVFIRAPFSSNKFDTLRGWLRAIGAQKTTPHTRRGWQKTVRHERFVAKGARCAPDLNEHFLLVSKFFFFFFLATVVKRNGMPSAM